VILKNGGNFSLKKKDVPCKFSFGRHPITFLKLIPALWNLKGLQKFWQINIFPTKLRNLPKSTVFAVLNYQKKGTFSSFCAIFQGKKDHEVPRSCFESQGLPFLKCPRSPPVPTKPSKPLEDLLNTYKP